MDLWEKMKDDTLALGFASDRGHLQIVKYLVARYKQEFDYRKPFWIRGHKEGCEILKFAVAKGHLEVMKFLLDHHKHKLYFGEEQFALQDAALFAQFETINYFWTKGTDLYKTHAKMTPLLYLGLRKDKPEERARICKLLVDFVRTKEVLDVTMKGGLTALMIASLTGQKKLVEILVQGGADVNLVSDQGFSALVFAFFQKRFTNNSTIFFQFTLGKSEIANVLMENGADISFARNYIQEIYPEVLETFDEICKEFSKKQKKKLQEQEENNNIL